MLVNVALLALFAAISSYGLYKLKSASGIFTEDFIIGFAAYGSGFLIWYSMLTRLPLSVLFPIAAGALIIGSQIVGSVFLREQLHTVNIVGVGLVLTGIVLIHLKA